MKSDMMVGSVANIFSTVLDAELRWMHGMHGRLKFFDYMAHYMKRDFTVEADVYPAFKGILSILDNQSYFGIVVFTCTSHDPNTDSLSVFLRRVGFAHGLLWEVDEYSRFSTMNYTRRESVPSWSWMSLKESRPRLSSLDSELSTARNNIGLACVTTPLGQGNYVADIAVTRDDGTVVDIGMYLEQHSHQKIAPELKPVLEITSVFSPISWTLLGDTYKSHKLECTFVFGKPHTYIFDDNGAKFDGGNFRNLKSGIAVLLLIEKYVTDATSRSYRWLIIRARDREGSDIYESYERIGLLTWKEHVGNSKDGRILPMSKMVEENTDRKSTFIVK